MLRRPPTTLQLDQQDVSDLIAELEEQKLQLQIQSQRKNLVRTSTVKQTVNDEDSGVSLEPYQMSPLTNKKNDDMAKYLSTTEDSRWPQNKTQEPVSHNGNALTDRNDSNPFY